MARKKHLEGLDKGGEEKKILDAADEIDEIKEKQIEGELVLGYKEFKTEGFKKFKDSDIKSVRIYKPTIGQETELDSFYARKYAEYLKNSDYVTRKQMEVILKERGINVEQMNDELEELDERIGKIIEKIVSIRSEFDAVKDTRLKEKHKETMSALSLERDVLKKIRSKKWTERESLFNGAIENLVEQDRLLKKLAMCIKFEDGKQVWVSDEEIKSEEDVIFVRNLTNDALYFWAGISENFLDKFLEEIIGGIV